MGIRVSCMSRSPDDHFSLVCNCQVQKRRGRGNVTLWGRDRLRNLAPCHPFNAKPCRNEDAPDLVRSSGASSGLCGRGDRVRVASAGAKSTPYPHLLSTAKPDLATNGRVPCRGGARYHCEVETSIARPTGHSRSISTLGRRSIRLPIAFTAYTCVIGSMRLFFRSQCRPCKTVV